jgi:hypothetical protein
MFINLRSIILFQFTFVSLAMAFLTVVHHTTIITKALATKLNHMDCTTYLNQVIVVIASILPYIVNTTMRCYLILVQTIAYSINLTFVINYLLLH